MKRFLIFIASIAILCLFLNYIADHVIFRPLEEVAPMPEGFKELVFNTSDGTELHAAYKTAAPGKDTILFFHGNAGNISYYIQFADIYSAMGYGVFMFDYRGFGKSKGTLNQSNFFTDAKAALDYFLLKLNIAPKESILFSHSLGNAALIEAVLAYNGTPFKALVLQSPFTNTPEMAASFLYGKYDRNALVTKVASKVFYPILSNKLFNNIAKISKIKQPIFMLYTKQDMLIPWQMSDALFKAAPQGSKNFISEHGGHNNFEWGAEAVQDYLLGLEG